MNGPGRKPISAVHASAASLVGAAAQRGIPIVFQIQDWWLACARANLLDAERRLCSGPAPGKCTACLPLTGLPPAPLLNRLRGKYRQRDLTSPKYTIAGGRRQEGSL